jgi:hypothetical protein
MSKNERNHAAALDGITNRPLLDRLAWRLAEWEMLTGTSRVTVWRQIRDGDLHVIRIGSVKMIPRAEAVRLGMIAG